MLCLSLVQGHIWMDSQCMSVSFCGLNWRLSIGRLCLPFQRLFSIQSSTSSFIKKLNWNWLKDCFYFIFFERRLSVGTFFFDKTRYQPCCSTRLLHSSITVQRKAHLLLSINGQIYSARLRVGRKAFSKDHLLFSFSPLFQRRPHPLCVSPLPNEHFHYSQLIVCSCVICCPFDCKLHQSWPFQLSLLPCNKIS